MKHLRRPAAAVAATLGLGAAALLADAQAPPSSSPSTTPEQSSPEKSQPETSTGRVREVRTRSEFDRILRSTEGLVLVDFNATWCAPCRLLRPVLDDFAAANAGSVTVLSVDVDRNVELAQRYGVNSIPALLLCRDGEPVRGQVGLTDNAGLRRLVFER
jgi:thioredoxin 1